MNPAMAPSFPASDVMAARDFLREAAFAKGATGGDTGGGLGSADLWLTIGDTEYFIQVSPAKQRVRALGNREAAHVCPPLDEEFEAESLDDLKAQVLKVAEDAWADRLEFQRQFAAPSPPPSGPFDFAASMDRWEADMVEAVMKRSALFSSDG